MESLARLQGLHADLVAFTEKRLATLDRLLFDLETTLDDFRTLLDKPEPTDQDKESYKAGKVVLVDGADVQEFAINDEFRHISVALGTAIDLNEIETAKILVRDYGESIAPNITFIAKAVADYHDRRDLLLQSLRLVLQQADDLDLEPDTRMGVFEHTVKEVLQTIERPDNASIYIAKCLNGLQALEERYHTVNSQLHNRQTVGQLAGPEFEAILEFQKSSLFKQHEALACILAYLFKPEPGYSTTNDLHKLHNATQRWQKPDALLVHYLPAFSSAFRKNGSIEHSAERGTTETLNGIFGAVPKSDRPATPLDPFLAVLRAWWTVQYGSMFVAGSEHHADAKKCPEQLQYALKEHGLRFLLTVASSVSHNAWRHPARQELVTLLRGDSADLISGHDTSEYFKVTLMESFEVFIEGWISNLPDSIRQLKHEEDELRLEQIAAMQEGIRPDPKTDQPLPMHLEAFLVLISFAFEGRPEAAEQWWEDPESTLYGFLIWASKRQTVPRVSAFCEMLCSISEGPDGAASAHSFLLEESVSVSAARARRIPTMNYAQMFAELDLYARKVHERSATSHLPNRRILPTDMNEAESPIMLSSYLRLIAHLCRNSKVTRQFVRNHSTLDFTKILLLLSSGPVPSYLKASIFATLDAMLTDKDEHDGRMMWITLDDWASNTTELVKALATNTAPQLAPTIAALQNTLASVSSSIDQYDAFVSLLRSLITPVPGVNLPTFPGDLGSKYRAPGIGPYLDFLCGQIFTKRLGEVSESSQGLLCTFHCLDAIAIGLNSFDENTAKRYSSGLSKSASTEDVTYMRRHPFARLMQWVLSTEMEKPLMRVFNTSEKDVIAAPPGSPLVQSIQRSVDVINVTLSLQSTFYDVVKPLLKETPYEKSVVGSATMEEHVLVHPTVILDLCRYAASDHLELALKALSLLQKLSSSAKLNNHFLSQRTLNDSRRIVDLLGPNATISLASVSEQLSDRLQVDERELEGGFENQGYLYKDGVIAFLNACLETQPELANIAHILLGFKRLGERLAIADSFEDGRSLFDGLVMLVRDYPHGDSTGLVSWLIHIKSAGMQILRQLWSSTVSAEITISQLRRYQFLRAMIASQDAISENTLWDGQSLQNKDYWFYGSAEALTELLDFRSALYLYASQEIRAASAENLMSILKQHLQTLLGSDIAGAPLGHANLFDLADFLALDLSADLDVPQTQYFAKFDPSNFMTSTQDDKPDLADVALVRDALQRELDGLVQRQGQPPSGTAIDQDQANFELEVLAAHFEAKNRLVLARHAWRQTLKSYVDMLVAVIDSCPMDASAKMQFILQVLQLILPKLDALVAQESEDTVELARIADSLLFALSSLNKNDLVRDKLTDATASQDRLKQERLDNIITEKLFQLFRTSIDGILMANGASGQRSILYSICTQYLNRVTTSGSADSDTNRKARANSMDCVRSSNMRLINILSDDAEDGADSSRLNALHILGLLVALARGENSPYVLDALIKANVLEIIVEPIKHIATDFQDTEPSLRRHLLTLHQARMLLLLQISLTRSGAAAILDAGLMTAVRDSLLFRADPDLGFSAPTSANGNKISSFNQSFNPMQARNAAALSQQFTTNVASQAALQSYYELLAPMLRVLLSVFTSRGSQNEQAVYLARSFLTDYRANMVGIFKKWRGVSGLVNREGERVLSECVTGYTGLVAMSGWREWEDGDVDGGMDGVENSAAVAEGGAAGSIRMRQGYGFS